MNSSPRDDAAAEFLARSGWGAAACEFLSGDASFRSYQRVILGDQQAVLMDAPPEKEPLAPFIQMAEYLNRQGYSAPRIMARDTEAGFLLLEDLGDNLYSHALAKNPAKEAELYLTAVDQLVDMHRQQDTLPKLPEYSEALLLEEASLFVDWYLAALLGEQEAQPLKPKFLSLWRELFARAPFLPSVVVLRDYHADNLLWLPEREGIAKVGLLDFQDAVLGSPAYDLVSLVEDARREVQPETAMTVINHYIQQMKWDADAFMACYAMLGAQRNCKIIGIFTRLAKRDGKPRYLEMIPRVWRHLEHDLRHPMIRPLQEWMDKILPPESRDLALLAEESLEEPKRGEAS